MLIKYVGIFITFCVLSGCMATTPYVPSEQTNIVNIEDLKQTELYNSTRQWFSEYFVSGESVIDYEDPNTGTIIGNGVANNGTDALGLIPYKFRYSIRVDTKDGKLRVITKVIEHYMISEGRKKEFLYVNQKLEDSAHLEIKALIQNLEMYIIQNKNSATW